MHEHARDDTIDNQRYDIFISHSSRLDPDGHELVDALAEALRRRGFAVFTDRSQLKRRSKLFPSLEKAIKQSSVGLVVMTRQAMASAWVALELETMQRQRAAGTMRVLALRLDMNCPLPPGMVPEDVIDPPNLHDLTDIANRLTATIRTLP